MAIAVDLLVFEQFDLPGLGGPYEVVHAAVRRGGVAGDDAAVPVGASAGAR